MNICQLITNDFIMSNIVLAILLKLIRSIRAMIYSIT